MNKTIKHDRFLAARGGSTKIFVLRCNKCRHEVARYQKDGNGKLLRLYLDRIVGPDSLVKKLAAVADKKSMPNLVCEGCGQLLALPMVYKSENRLALRLLPGAVIKEKTKPLHSKAQRHGGDKTGRF